MNQVVSEYRNDPDFRELLEMFVAEMPNRRSALERAYLRWDFDQLKVQAHQLKGSAGGYGFGGLSCLAAGLEEACRRNEPSEVAEKLREMLEQLAQVCV